MSYEGFNAHDVQTYLRFLNPYTSRFTCCFLNKESLDRTIAYVFPECGCAHITPEEIIRGYEMVPEFQQTTLHVTLNETNFKGRTIGDIQGVRTLCLDLDTKHTQEQIREMVATSGCHLCVESSPGKYHLYWKVSPTLSIGQWKKYQLGLAVLYEGDTSLDEVQKTIRVPGVPRITKDNIEFVPRIVWMSEAATTGFELSENQIAAQFPGIIAAYQRGEDVKKEQRRKLLEIARNKATLNGEFKEFKGQGRNNLLYMVLKTAAAAVQFTPQGAVSEPHDEVTLKYLADIYNAEFPERLDDLEVDKIVKSALKRGLKLRDKRIEKNKGVLANTLAVVRDALTSGTPTSEVSVPDVSAVPVAGAASGVPTTGTEFNSEFQYNYNSEALAMNRFTDVAVVDRVLQRFGHRMVRIGTTMYAFSDSDKTWRMQEPRLCPETHRFVSDCLYDTTQDPRFIPDLCTNDEGEISPSKLRRNQEKFQSVRLKSNIVSSVLQEDKVKTVESSIFDAHTSLLYCGNGVIDMAQPATTPRDATAADYLLARTPIEYYSGEECPGWKAFLREIFAWNEDPEGMVNFIQELFGYSLSGEVTEQKIFCHYGDGANGKSKLLFALRTIAGEYSTIIDPDEISVKQNFSQKSFERFGSKIEGKHIAVIDDLEVKTVWNEAFVKGVTADKIRARAEFERSREVTNRAKLHVGLNSVPTPQSENYGILRRLCLIPYVRTFKHSPAKSTEIDQMIREEASGILYWAIEGYRRVRAHGAIEYPPETEIALEEYREEYFDTEVALEAMFAAPSIDPTTGTSNGEWCFGDDLVVEVNHWITSRGKTGTVDARKLGRFLTGRLGCQVERRVWNSEKRMQLARYFIQKKYRKDDLVQNSLPLLQSI